MKQDGKGGGWIAGHYKGNYTDIERMTGWGQ